MIHLLTHGWRSPPTGGFGALPSFIADEKAVAVYCDSLGAMMTRAFQSLIRAVRTAP
jgi:hypothetical protein